ncbi:hypothetical protein ACERK3_15840 [Phycisphaerales bacterium AB-hyl4]|uniref:Uncharacterized protein n=1 Tax=Natronomicrosphaera hydrolytica TaxID=3242702 RepID=A0ABV4UA94_9BACT
MALVAVIFVSISALSARPTPLHLQFLPAWVEMNTMLFPIAMLPSLPLLAATLRKRRAACMLMAEALITGSRSRE